ALLADYLSYRYDLSGARAPVTDALKQLRENNPEAYYNSYKLEVTPADKQELRTYLGLGNPPPGSGNSIIQHPWPLAPSASDAERRAYVQSTNQLAARFEQAEKEWAKAEAMARGRAIVTFLDPTGGVDAVWSVLEGDAGTAVLSIGIPIAGSKLAK